MKPEISIVVPVYNVEPYLEEALHSILSQTFGHERLQVIMVNDNSTDKSGEIMEQYSSKYKNFISIHLPERSGAAGKPRNVGVERADGKFIMFLDPDDKYEPVAVETLYSKITSDNSDIVVGMYRYSSNKKDHIGKFVGKNGLCVDDIEQFPQILEMNPAIWSKIFKTELIRENNIRFPEGIAAQDLVFSVNSYLNARRISFVERIVYNYRIRDKEDKSISHASNKKYFQDLNCALQLTYKICETHDKVHLFKYIMKDKIDYLLDQIIASDISSNEVAETLSKMRWLFGEETESGFKDKWKYWLLDDLKKGEIDPGVGRIETIRYFKKHIEEIGEGKQWLEQQLTNHQIEMQNQKRYIEELEDLKSRLLEEIEAKNRAIEEIGEGKQWLEQQLTNHQIEMQNQNRYIEELEDQKSRLCEQIETKDEAIQELTHSARLLENETDVLKKQLEASIKEIEELKTFRGWIRRKFRRPMGQ